MKQHKLARLLKGYILGYWLLGCTYIAYESQFPDYYWIHHIANGQPYPYPLGGVIFISTLFSICLIFYYLIIRPATFYQFWLRRYVLSAIYLFLIGLALLVPSPMHTPSFVAAGMLVLIYGSFLQILAFPFFYLLMRHIGKKRLSGRPDIQPPGHT